MLLGMEIRLGPGHILLAVDPAPPLFVPCLLWPNDWMDQDGTWTEVGLSSGDFVLDGDPLSTSQKGGGAPKFSAHVYCGQTTGWINMALGMQAGLSPGDFVLDGDPAPSLKKRRRPLPNFRPISIMAKRLHASTCHLV